MQTNVCTYLLLLLLLQHLVLFVEIGPVVRQDPIGIAVVMLVHRVLMVVERVPCGSSSRGVVGAAVCGVAAGEDQGAAATATVSCWDWRCCKYT